MKQLKIVMVNALRSYRMVCMLRFRDGGGTIRLDVLDACFVLTLLDCIGIHYEQWSKQEWFAPRLQWWHQENLEPYVQGERIYADDLYLLHVQG